MKVVRRYLSDGIAVAPTWEDIVKACSELGELGVNRVHINTLREHMINSGFDAELCRVGIAEAVGCGLLLFQGGYIALRKDSQRTGNRQPRSRAPRRAAARIKTRPGAFPWGDSSRPGSGQQLGTVRDSSGGVDWSIIGQNMVGLWQHLLSLRLQNYVGRTMSATAEALFKTVPRTDPLKFWANNGLSSRKVVEFLQLDRDDVAKISHVSSNSVRYDEKIPKELREHLEQIAVVCTLVADFFSGDVTKTALWFRTPNPMMGNISPREMIRYGRMPKLQKVILNAFGENQ